MTTRRKFSTWLQDVQAQLARPTVEGKHSELFMLGMDAYRLFVQLDADPVAVRELVAVLRLVREGTGVGRAKFEEDVMSGLSWRVRAICDDLVNAGVARQDSLTLPASIPRELRASAEVVLLCCEHAVDCLAFVRPRDALAGKRRRYALELLGKASLMFEMPASVMDFVRKTLTSGRPPALIGALVFCDSYKERGEPLPAEFHPLLLGVAERTDRRGVASGALSVLVEAGKIGEGEAMDRIDDWKDRNDPWRRQAGAAGV